MLRFTGNSALRLDQYDGRATHRSTTRAFNGNRNLFYPMYLRNDTHIIMLMCDVGVGQSLRGVFEGTNNQASKILLQDI